MKTNKILLITTLLLTIPSISQAEDFHIASEKLNSNNIKLCNNKTVKIVATTSNNVMQHPMGMHDTLDFATKKINRTHENYIDFDGMQIVATSKETIKCSEKVEIEGTVDLVDLGGEAGKDSYKNVWIKTHQYNCID